MVGVVGVAMVPPKAAVGVAVPRSVQSALAEEEAVVVLAAPGATVQLTAVVVEAAVAATVEEVGTEQAAVVVGAAAVSALPTPSAAETVAAGAAAAVAVASTAEPQAQVALALAPHWRTTTVGRAALAILQTVALERRGMAAHQMLRVAHLVRRPYPDCQVMGLEARGITSGEATAVVVAVVVATHATPTIPSRRVRAFRTMSRVVAAGAAVGEIMQTPAVVGRARSASSTQSSSNYS